MKTRGRVTWFTSSPFILMHLAVLTAFFVPFSWGMVALCILSYYARMFFVTAGYHRYFSHRTYKVNRVTQFFIALFGCTTLQKGPLWWAANHRHHHKFSDKIEDIHSPLQMGFWWSHVGWILSDQHEKTLSELVPDLMKYPELRWLNRYHLIPVILYALAMFLVFGTPGLVWGFVISSVLLWHGTFTINSLSHVYGSQRYVSDDTSRNNWILALITMGEGWHNNHHAYMSSTNQGFFWWEVDMSYYLLKMFAWVGIVHGIRKPPLELLEAKLIKQGTANPSFRELRRAIQQQLPIAPQKSAAARIS